MEVANTSPLESVRRGGVDGCARALSVCILATTESGTRTALATARCLTGSQPAPIVLLVRCAGPIDADRVDSPAARATIAKFDAFAAAAGVEARVLCAACRSIDDIVHLVVDRSSLIIIGGKGRTVWGSREQRLATRLSAHGYSVVFADERGQQWWPVDSRF